MKIARVVRTLTQDPMAAPLALLLVLAIALVILDFVFWPKLDWAGVLVEMHGLFVELLLIGCGLYWFTLRVGRREAIARDREKLQSLLHAEDPHSLSVKSALIKKLSSLREPLGDLFAIRLPGQHLPGVAFDEANLQAGALKACMLDNSQFVRANLRDANFEEAWIRFSNFDSADLSFAEFSGASLVGADFTGAHLQGTKFVGADLRRANFSNAFVLGANFNGANMEGALGLEPQPAEA